MLLGAARDGREVLVRGQQVQHDDGGVVLEAPVRPLNSLDQLLWTILHAPMPLSYRLHLQLQCRHELKCMVTLMPQQVLSQQLWQAVADPVADPGHTSHAQPTPDAANAGPP